MTNKIKTKPFWEYPLGTHSEFTVEWAGCGLAHKAFEENQTNHYYYNNGALLEGVDIKNVLEYLHTRHDLRPVYHQIPYSSKIEEQWMYCREDCAVKIDYRKADSGIDVFLYCNDYTTAAELTNYFKGLCTKRPTKGKVFILVSGSAGPYLKAMGVAGEDFIEGNYTPDVVEGYRHITEDLSSNDPCGRIVILDGPPGTGKTHLVRSLLNEVEKSMFVLIPSNLMSQMGDPSFIQALMDERRGGIPLILIVEDADEAISSRKADNVSAISALLNFSDGIFGSVLDMRIIATTNIEVTDLDDAVVRAGRLCRRIEVGKLDKEQAKVVYNRIVEERGAKPEKEPKFKEKFYTLGEVYSMARDSGQNTPVSSNSKSKNTVGFVPDNSDEVTIRVSRTYSATELERMLNEDNDDDLIDEDPLDDEDDNE